VTTCCVLLASSTYFIVTWCPLRPPALLTSCAHRSYPCLSALPSPEKSPLWDIDTPIVMGAAGVVGVLVVPPHAMAVIPSAATAAAIKRLCMLAPSLLRGFASP